jgi:hypothetical protein
MAEHHILLIMAIGLGVAGAAIALALIFKPDALTCKEKNCEREG